MKCKECNLFCGVSAGHSNAFSVNREQIKHFKWMKSKFRSFLEKRNSFFAFQTDEKQHTVFTALFNNMRTLKF